MYSLEHRWTVSNFTHLYQDSDWSVCELESAKFYSTIQENNKFYLVLCPNGVTDGWRNNLSIFLFYTSPEKTRCLHVHWKISIIDGKGKKYGQNKFTDTSYTGGFKNYITVLKVLDPSNGLLYEGKLTLFCEVQVLEENETTIGRQNPSVEESQSNTNSIHRIVSSLSHKWTINNFTNCYRDELKMKIEEGIESDKFRSNLNHQFHLRLYLNGERDVFQNNLTVYLCHSSIDINDLSVRWMLSIIDHKENKRNIRGVYHVFNQKQNKRRFGTYFSVTELFEKSNGLLHGDTLILNCEIQIIDDSNDVSKIEKSAQILQISESCTDFKLIKQSISQETITTATLERILTQLIDKNQLIVSPKTNKTVSESSVKYDFSNSRLENVIFTCNNSSSSLRDFIIQNHHQTSSGGGINKEEIYFITSNLDQLIKFKFEDLICTLKGHRSLQPVIINELIASKQRSQSQVISSPLLEKSGKPGRKRDLV